MVKTIVEAGKITVPDGTPYDIGVGDKATIEFDSGRIVVPDGTRYDIGDSVAVPPPPLPPPLIAIPESAPNILTGLSKTGKRMAFSYGINNYPGCPLQGCVNDMNQDVGELETNYSFPADIVRLLQDERCNADAFWERLAWLKAGAQPDGTGWISGSGHGAQVAHRDENGNIDRLDCLICMQNFSWDKPETWVTHIQLVAFLKDFPAGYRLTMKLDVCHAGEMDRSLNRNSKPRRIDTPSDVMHGAAAARALGYRVNRELSPLAHLKLVFIPGCRADQTSSDTQNDNGDPCGACTDNWWKATHSRPGQIVKEIGTVANQYLASGGYEQVIVPDGSAIDKVLLPC